MSGAKTPSSCLPTSSMHISASLLLVSWILETKHHHPVSPYPPCIHLNTNLLHPDVWRQNTIVLSPHILHAHICILITCILDIGDKTSSSCLPISSMHPFEHKSPASRCPETKHHRLVSPHPSCTYLHPIFIPSHILGSRIHPQLSNSTILLCFNSLVCTLVDGICEMLKFVRISHPHYLTR